MLRSALTPIGWLLSALVASANAEDSPNTIALTASDVATKSPPRNAGLGNLREENITDEEVREVQKVVDEKMPGEIRRIGPVTVGCGCAERPGCTNELVIVVKTKAMADEVTLARVRKVWQLSELQQLELRRQRIREKRRLMSTAPAQERAAYRKELEREEQLLLNDLPACLKKMPNWILK
jgi:hypothetical protein